MMIKNNLKKMNNKIKKNKNKKIKRSKKIKNNKKKMIALRMVVYNILLK